MYNYELRAKKKQSDKLESDYISLEEKPNTVTGKKTYN